MNELLPHSYGVDNYHVKPNDPLSVYNGDAFVMNVETNPTETTRVLAEQMQANARKDAEILRLKAALSAQSVAFLPSGQVYRCYLCGRTWKRTEKPAHVANCLLS